MSERSRAQRLFLGTIVALTRGVDVRTADKGSLAVANFIIRNPEQAASAILVLVTKSANDPLPCHCFLIHSDGRRLIDSNRVCRIQDHEYEWPSQFDGHWNKGAIVSRILVCNLISSSSHDLRDDQQIFEFRRRSDDRPSAVQ